MEQAQERLAQLAEQGNHHSNSTAVATATASAQTTRCPRHLWMRFKQHKSNKSAGSEGLAAELFKMGPERITVEMHQQIVKVWVQ